MRRGAYSTRYLSLMYLKEHMLHNIWHGITIDRANQVWSTDITYIRLRGGFLYLVAIIDWFSRYVPSLANLSHIGDRLLSGGT